MAFKNVDIEQAYCKLMHYKNRNRSQEEIIDDLKTILKTLKESDFIMHIMSMFLSIDGRDSEIFEHIDSPMRQFAYLIDLYYSIPDRCETEAITNAGWKAIALLLEEMEMNNFINIGFSNDGDLFHDEKDDKVSVSLQSFVSYFSNASLCYEEQILERTTRLSAFNELILNEFGFEIEDATAFALHMHQLCNRKLTELVYGQLGDNIRYFNDKKEWERLTTGFINAGIPSDQWILQPELHGLKSFLATKPATIVRHSEYEIMSADIQRERLERIVEFLKYDPHENTGKTVYYAGHRLFEDRPLLLVEGSFVCPHGRFVIEAFYNRLNAYLLTTKKKDRYIAYRSRRLEDKIVEIMRKLFGKKAEIYIGYSVDGKCEQDILVGYKGHYLIIEAKDHSFREPRREPLSAYERIRSDFRKAIQAGYGQCLRVKERLLGDEDVTILDGKDFKKVLGKIRASRVIDCFSIVVTQYKYGPIQTDLSLLLQKDDDLPYPWSVCIDDLESFVLLLNKALNRRLICDRFIEFIEYRNKFNGHIICFDELELCGLFICQRGLFKELAESEDVVNAFAGMADIFDAHYHSGLGFDNEIDADIKSRRPPLEYSSVFGVKKYSGIRN